MNFSRIFKLVLPTVFSARLINRTCVKILRTIREITKSASTWKTNNKKATSRLQGGPSRHQVTGTSESKSTSKKAPNHELETGKDVFCFPWFVTLSRGQHLSHVHFGHHATRTIKHMFSYLSKGSSKHHLNLHYQSVNFGSFASDKSPSCGRTSSGCFKMTLLLGAYFRKVKSSSITTCRVQ